MLRCHALLLLLRRVPELAHACSRVRAVRLLDAVLLQMRRCVLLSRANVRRRPTL